MIFCVEDDRAARDLMVYATFIDLLQLIPIREMYLDVPHQTFHLPRLLLPNPPFRLNLQYCESILESYKPPEGALHSPQIQQFHLFQSFAFRELV